MSDSPPQTYHFQHLLNIIMMMMLIIIIIITGNNILHCIS